MPYFPSEEEVQKLKASARCDQPGDDLNSVPSACRFRCSSRRLGDGTWGQVFAGRRNARGAASEFAKSLHIVLLLHASGVKKKHRQGMDLGGLSRCFEGMFENPSPAKKS